MDPVFFSKNNRYIRWGFKVSESQLAPIPETQFRLRLEATGIRRWESDRYVAESRLLFRFIALYLIRKYFPNLPLVTTRSTFEPKPIPASHRWFYCWDSHGNGQKRGTKIHATAIRNGFRLLRFGERVRSVIIWIWPISSRSPRSLINSRPIWFPQGSQWGHPKRIRALNQLAKRVVW